MYDIVYFYITVPIFLVITYSVGHLFFFYSKAKNANRLSAFLVFEKLLLGLIILITVYSFIRTNGATVNLIFVPIIGCYVFFRNNLYDNEYIPYPNRNIFFVFTIIIVCSVLFFVYLNGVFDFKQLRFVDTSYDYQFYSKTAQFLNMGYETVGQFDAIALGKTFTPYHYFELWVAAFIAWMFQVPMQIATSVIMPSVLGSISFVGLFGFSKRQDLSASVIVFMLLFISSVTLFSSILNKVGVTLPLLAGDISSVVSYFKLYPILLFLILTTHHLLNQHPVLAICCLLFIPVATIVLAPIIIVFCLGLVILLQYSRSKLRYVGLLMALILIVTVSFSVFYFFLWDKGVSNSIFGFDTFENHVVILIHPLHILFNTSPFLVLLLLLKSEINIQSNVQNQLLCSALILSIIALVLVSLSVTNYDGIQFFTNLIIPISTVLIAVLFLSIDKDVLKKRFVVASFFGVLLLSSLLYSVKYIYTQKTERHNYVFVNQVSDYFNGLKQRNIYCAYIHSKTYYSDYYMHSISKVFRVMGCMDNSPFNLIEIGISDFDAIELLNAHPTYTDVEKKMALSRIPEGTFYQYVMARRKNGMADETVSQLQFSFLKEFHISHLLIQNNATIPQHIKSKLTRICSEQTPQGYTLYMIDLKV